MRNDKFRGAGIECCLDMNICFIANWYIGPSRDCKARRILWARVSSTVVSRTGRARCRNGVAPEKERLFLAFSKRWFNVWDAKGRAYFAEKRRIALFLRTPVAIPMYIRLFFLPRVVCLLKVACACGSTCATQLCATRANPGHRRNFLLFATL